MDLVYKNEKTLFALMLVLSLLAWPNSASLPWPPADAAGAP